MPLITTLFIVVCVQKNPLNLEVSGFGYKHALPINAILPSTSKNKFDSFPVRSAIIISGSHSLYGV